MNYPHTPRCHGGAGRPSEDCSMADEIVNLIDQHLAWQESFEERERGRRGSTGTLIVDWDGVGDMRVHQRSDNEHQDQHQSRANQTSQAPRQHPRLHFQAPTHASQARFQQPQPRVQRRPQASSRSSSLSRYKATTASTMTSQAPSRHDSFLSTHHHHDTQAAYTSFLSIHRPRPFSTNNLQVHYNTATNTVHGHDPSTAFAYDYNGRIVHVHREAARPSSQVSEYYHVPVETYRAGAELEIVDKALPRLAEESKKREKAVRFVQKVLWRLDGLGILGKMRMERKNARGYGA
jgi:hypothetical protein